jgi:hypothetical protein
MSGYVSLEGVWRKEGSVGKKGVWVPVLQDDPGVDCCKPLYNEVIIHSCRDDILCFQ